MPRTARSASTSLYHHVTMRGVAQRTIFEDDNDRFKFLDILIRTTAESCCSMLAWCLMSNHFHLLIAADINELSRFMRRIASTYATYFNKKYNRSGHLFQNRFDSRDIDSEHYLLAAVRYIHRNPVAAHLCPTCNYPWSSYREYIQKPILCDTDFVLSFFDGIDDFVEFHNLPTSKEESKHVQTRRPHLKVSDKEALQIACEQCGKERLNLLETCDQPVRDQVLADIKATGLPLRQISRITGMGYNIVQRA